VLYGRVQEVLQEAFQADAGEVFGADAVGYRARLL
jgi:hypothetical protein